YAVEKNVAFVQQNDAVQASRHSLSVAAKPPKRGESCQSAPFGALFSISGGEWRGGEPPPPRK
ncbi:MAG: hypothetical protein IJC99_02020, partial [Clostridia bacterium]|nr:hypothetical protein [Clostridia bacterium]